jgi:hypothetical protein
VSPATPWTEIELPSSATGGGLIFVAVVLPVGMTGTAWTELTGTGDTWTEMTAPAAVGTEMDVPSSTWTELTL